MFFEVEIIWIAEKKEKEKEKEKEKKKKRKEKKGREREIIFSSSSKAGSAKVDGGATNISSSAEQKKKRKKEMKQGNKKKRWQAGHPVPNAYAFWYNSNNGTQRKNKIGIDGKGGRVYVGEKFFLHVNLFFLLLFFLPM